MYVSMIDWPIPGNDSWDNYKKEKKLDKDLEKSAVGRLGHCRFFCTFVGSRRGGCDIKVLPWWLMFNLFSFNFYVV